MTTHRDLLDAEEHAWNQLHALFDRVADWTRPGLGGGEWCAKDLLSHLTAWHALTTDRLEGLRATGELPPRPDIDEFNARMFAECRDLTLDDVRAMSGASRHRFREEIAMVADPVDDAIASLIAGNAHEHYADHLSDLDAYVQERP